MAKTTEKKQKKRKWYEIISKDFNNTVLGETITKDSNSVINRIIKANLGHLSREVKLQNVTIVFKIKELKEEKFYTEPYGYTLGSSYVKRVVKNKKTKLDDSFVIKSKDGIKVRIKPLMITRINVNRSTGSVLLKKSRELFNDYVSKKDYSEFFKDLIYGKVSPGFKKILSKTYPLSFFEVRIMKRLD